MLQKLSYFNLAFAIAYMLIYLKSGTFSSSAGIFSIIVMNWLYLRSYQLDHYRWTIWHYLIGLWCFYYIGKLIYGSAYIIISAAEVDFMGSETLIFLLLTGILSAAVLYHLFGYWMKNHKKLIR